MFVRHQEFTEILLFQWSQMAYLMGLAELDISGTMVIKETRVLSTDNPTMVFDKPCTWVTICEYERPGTPMSFMEARTGLFKKIQSWYWWIPNLPEDYYRWLSGQNK